ACAAPPRAATAPTIAHPPPAPPPPRQPPAAPAAGSTAAGPDPSENDNQPSRSASKDKQKRFCAACVRLLPRYANGSNQGIAYPLLLTCFRGKRGVDEFIDCAVSS